MWENITSLPGLFSAGLPYTVLSGIDFSLYAWSAPTTLARIRIKSPSIRSVFHPLLTWLREVHSQALMYSLSVLLDKWKILIEKDGTA